MTRSTPQRLCLVLAAMVGLSGHSEPAQAQPAPKQTVDPAVVVIDVVFDELEKAIIREFGLEQQKEGGRNAKGHGPGKTPPGLARRDVLPPGLARRDVLPPGLQGRGLPDTLVARLPMAHPGTSRVQVGRDVVLIENATRRVLDVIRDVLQPQD